MLNMAVITECQCNGHASSCHYDSDKGEGVCDDCADGTTGSQCELCQEGYYRNSTVPVTDQDACLGEGAWSNHWQEMY